jgi:hypothetical protein
MLRCTLVLLHAAGSDAWCCRACHNCFCVLGICPAASPKEVPDPPILKWKVDEVADFLLSLGPDGSRNTCRLSAHPTCPVPPYFVNASRMFRAKGINGPRLIHLMNMHQDHLEGGSVHNDSLRHKHAEWWSSHGLMPDPPLTHTGVPDLSAYLSFALRLSTAVSERMPIGANQSIGATLDQLDRNTSGAWEWSHQMGVHTGHRQRTS